VNEVNKLRKGKRKRSTRTFFFFFFCPEYFYVCFASDVQLYIPSGVRGGLNILSFILRFIYVLVLLAVTRIWRLMKFSE
jgi:hypothetical protein